MSDYLLDKPPLQRASGGDAGAQFLRNAPSLPEPARPRTFDAYMGQRQQGGRTRLQQLRAKHGWSLFRSKNSAGGRAYRDALRAEKWRFTGGAEKIAKGEVFRDEDGQISDRKLAKGYRAMKQGLKAGAGWRRFIPFTSARRDYKAALKSLQTGNLGNDNALTPYDRLRGTSAYQRTVAQGLGIPMQPTTQKPEDLQDLHEVQGLLNQQHDEVHPAQQESIDEEVQGQGAHDQVGNGSGVAGVLEQDAQSEGEGSEGEDFALGDGQDLEGSESGEGDPMGQGQFGQYLKGLLPNLQAAQEEGAQ